MYFLLAVALLCTFVYLHLQTMDYINAKLNPYNDKADENVVLVAKVKYALLIIMSLAWAGVIRFW